MHPPWSMILFTTLAGAGQGLLLALVGIELAGLADAAGLWRGGGALAVLGLCGSGLVAASFHLGHPLRAWRAAAMWRTSWLSREVIVLPAFMALVVAWALAPLLGLARPWGTALGLLAALLALALYGCTAMIYASVKTMRQWAHPLTVLNFGLLGMASGCLLASAWALLPSAAAPEAGRALAQIALALLLAGLLSRGLALRRNLGLQPKTTLQSAIGVRHPRIRQIAQGAMAGNFNTREFFHGRTPRFVLRMRWLAAGLGFVLPAVLVLLALAQGAPALLALAALLQLLGLQAERWCFFAEALHPQNLYQQSMA